MLFCIFSFTTDGSSSKCQSSLHQRSTLIYQRPWDVRKAWPACTLQ